jgi:hypothetical protein
MIGKVLRHTHEENYKALRSGHCCRKSQFSPSFPQEVMGESIILSICSDGQNGASKEHTRYIHEIRSCTAY